MDETILDIDEFDNNYQPPDIPTAEDFLTNEDIEKLRSRRIKKISRIIILTVLGALGVFGIRACYMLTNQFLSEILPHGGMGGGAPLYFVHPTEQSVANEILEEMKNAFNTPSDKRL